MLLYLDDDKDDKDESNVLASSDSRRRAKHSPLHIDNTDIAKNVYVEIEW
jgi:hypothetical protein